MNTVLVPGIYRGIYVVKAELYVDSDNPGVGDGLRANALDLSFDSPTENFKQVVHVGKLTEAIGELTVVVNQLLLRICVQGVCKRQSVFVVYVLGL